MTPTDGGTDRLLPWRAPSHLPLQGWKTMCGDGSHPTLTWGGLGGGSRRAAWRRCSSRLAQPHVLETHPAQWLTGQPQGRTFPGDVHQPVPTTGEPGAGRAGRQRTLCSAVPTNTSLGYWLPGLGCNMGCELLFNRPLDPGLQALLN